MAMAGSEKFATAWDRELKVVEKNKSAIKSSEGKAFLKLFLQCRKTFGEADAQLLKYGSGQSKAQALKILALAEALSKPVAELVKMDDPQLRTETGFPKNGAAHAEAVHDTLLTLSRNLVEEWNSKPQMPSSVGKGPWTRMWVQAKRDFESRTGRKKPGEKMLGVFRKSTGIENALADCERLVLKVSDAPTASGVAAMAAAHQKLRKTATDYAKQLNGAATGDGDAEYRKQVGVLADELDQVTGLLGQAVTVATEKWEVAPYDLKRCLATLRSVNEICQKGAVPAIAAALRKSVDDKDLRKHVLEAAHPVGKSLVALETLAKSGGAPSHLVDITTPAIARLKQFGKADQDPGPPWADQVRSHIETLATAIRKEEMKLTQAASAAGRL